MAMRYPGPVVGPTPIFACCATTLPRSTSRSANRFEALEPVRQGVHRCFGAIAPGVARGLKLRHDHGSNYMSGDFQDEIECLGICDRRSENPSVKRPNDSVGPD
jgi:hypothetical protein